MLPTLPLPIRHRLVRRPTRSNCAKTNTRNNSNTNHNHNTNTKNILNRLLQLVLNLIHLLLVCPRRTTISSIPTRTTKRTSTNRTTNTDRTRCTMCTQT